MKKVSILAVCISALTLFSCDGQKGKSSVVLHNTADSVAYGIGISIGSNMQKDGLDSLDLDILKKAIAAVFKKDSLMMNTQQAQTVIQSYLGEKQRQKGEANLAAGKKYLDENKKKPGVIVLPDGLQYSVVKQGTGPNATMADTVVIHYHGTLIDGTIFDSSVDKGEPAEAPVSIFVKGFAEALQLMNVGSKFHVVIPAELAYGERGSGPRVPPNSTLIFELEMLNIKGK